MVGHDPLPRTVVVSKVWEYIKQHSLQNEKNKREILADDKLKAVFGQGQGDHVRDETSTSRPHLKGLIRPPRAATRALCGGFTASSASSR